MSYKLGNSHWQPSALTLDRVTHQFDNPEVNTIAVVDSGGSVVQYIERRNLED